MPQIIKESIDNSINYSHYSRLMQKLVANNSSTGAKVTEANVNYTLLNERRMKRWDKRLKISDQEKEKICGLDIKVIWLVITESWCGDAAHVVPVMNKVAELNSNIDLRIVLRDDNDELMNRFLTNGGKSIPKLIMLDAKSYEVINTYGPRPSAVTTLVEDYKKEYGTLTTEFKENLQRWYNKDKGKTVITDLINLLEKQTTSFSL